ncbi:hypothetical protein LSCM1_00492 [Leishmania martiniquensis]|uniref:t-SNARE coiled-coil homology domain-containing protein n=1 Tax=Leishmania martiniquensis TaxID=1580590 RepID=A0A836GFK4_9TRYP|nr:hypothetical protein LSCM1_00492 [Leishmania martiniquensis]
MDISYQLWSLVEQARRSSTTRSGRTRPARRKRTAEEEQATESLLTTSKALDDTAVVAICRATANIAAVLAALDAATLSSTAHLQSSLLLSDAELLSVSSSLKAFTETLNKVAALTTTQSGRGRSDGVSSSAEGSDDGFESLSVGKPALQRAQAGSGVAAHLRQAVSILEQRIAAKRLQVALAKEELALYKTEMFLYGHCGMLSCSDDEAAELARYMETVRKDVVSRGQRGAIAGDSVGAGELFDDAGAQQRRHHSVAKLQPSMPGFGTTFRVVDGMVQRAAETFKVAGSHADAALQVALTGRHSAARELLHVGTASVAEMLMMGTGSGGGSRSKLSRPPAERCLSTSGVGAPPLPTLQPYQLTEDEEARLQEQNRALLQAQHEASAQDAKAVEASVRELSQLTSLMSEQVVQQNEQFSVLFKNTETAQAHLQKAVEEVQKPLGVFWNPTRQLVAALLMCTAVLLTANWASR